MIKLFLLFCLLLLSEADVEVQVSSHWSGGFQAKGCISITQALHSWKVTLHFDKPVASVEAYTAEVISSNDEKTEYVLGNKNWNGEEHVGDELCFEFQGHGSGDITPKITAKLEGVEGGGSHETQAPPVTLPPGTLAPGETQKPVNTLPLPSGDGIKASMVVKNDWATRNPPGFEGWITFKVDREVEGWIMHLTCSKPLASINPHQTTIYGHNEDSTTWTLVNTDDKLYMKPGDSWEFRFEAVLQGAGGAPECNAVIINMGVERNWTVTPRPNSGASKYNYDDVLMKSIMFYEAQRSGKLPANNRIPYRGDSALNDKGANGEDLTGGWYDAGDFVKFNYPMAWSTVVLTWGLLEFKDAYEAAGQLDWMYECIKWPLDYFIKCHVKPDELYVQVGDGGLDHGSWGRPEEMKMARPAFKIDASKPGSDISMETAAAFAAGSIAFKEKDPEYAATLLDHAKSLWDFAIKHPGKYSQSVSAAAAYYESANYTDENAWGSLWLYKATNDAKYLEVAKKSFDPSPDWGMSWDDVIVGNQILFYEATKEDVYKQGVIDTFNSWWPGSKMAYTPKGLAYRLQWGSLRYASNMAMAALMAAKHGIEPEKYRHWAMCQIHYALGDTGRSFVCGFGVNPPKSPHHRSSSCPIPPALCNMNILHLPTSNVHVLYGALVGGPDASDTYEDSRANYVNNEVACDYNAGFQTAVAALRSLLLQKQHPEQTGGATCPFK